MYVASTAYLTAATKLSSVGSMTPTVLLLGLMQIIGGPEGSRIAAAGHRPDNRDHLFPPTAKLRAVQSFQTFHSMSTPLSYTIAWVIQPGNSSSNSNRTATIARATTLSCRINSNSNRNSPKHASSQSSNQPLNALKGSGIHYYRAEKLIPVALLLSTVG